LKKGFIFNKTYTVKRIKMVQNILVAAAVILAFYFVIRFILNRLAGKAQANPCHGCTGCSMGHDQQQSQGCSVTETSLKDKSFEKIDKEE